MNERIDIDFDIKIGIKDKEIVEVIWFGMMIKGNNEKYKSYEELKEQVVRHLEKAVEFVKKL